MIDQELRKTGTANIVACRPSCFSPLAIESEQKARDAIMKVWNKRKYNVNLQAISINVTEPTMDYVMWGMIPELLSLTGITFVNGSTYQEMFFRNGLDKELRNLIEATGNSIEYPLENVTKYTIAKGLYESGLLELTSFCRNNRCGRCNDCRRASYFSQQLVDNGFEWARPYILSDVFFIVDGRNPAYYPYKGVETL